MNEQESNERLRQLLRLKRLETPPPGYFNRFQDGVFDRIQTVEAKRSRSPWRRWLFGHRNLGGAAPWRSLVNAGSVVGVLGVAVAGWFWIGGSTGEESQAPASVAAAAAASGGTGPSAVSRVEMQAPPAVSLGPEVAGLGLWKTAGPAVVPSVAPWSAQAKASRAIPEFASTNPLPEGLFRLPGSSGSEAYRVRFTGPAN